MKYTVHNNREFGPAFVVCDTAGCEVACAHRKADAVLFANGEITRDELTALNERLEAGELNRAGNVDQAERTK